ncbi:AAA family ATPase [Micromonospora chersina]|uniref:AAA family ATPase n=1 Tax=Micromonospora chersina TaxID=47854 RepID=UPI0033EEBB63
MFGLPSLGELTEEQLDVLALPVDDSHLIVGGPGTGKTVLAIYRTDLLVRAGRPTTLLMYNKVLSSYTRAAIASKGVDNVVSTWHKWFHAFWRDSYNEAPPKEGRWDVDWMACIARVGQEPPPPTALRHIVVDEGQDLPYQFYLLLRMISDQFTIFADDHQRISERQSTIREIRTASGIRQPTTLTINNRNTPPIAALAAHFRTNEDDAPERLAAAPLPTGGAPRPLLVRHDRRSDVIDHVLRFEAERPDDTIGVLLYRAADLRAFYRLLFGRTKHPVQGYLSQNRTHPLPELQFAQPGIKLLTWASAKGLQFDSVLLPELQAVPGDPSMDDLRMQLYVQITRARHRLHMMYTGSGQPELVRQLPGRLIEVAAPDCAP